jgi:hypothetical protein
VVANPPHMRAVKNQNRIADNMSLPRGKAMASGNPGSRLKCGSSGAVFILGRREQQRARHGRGDVVAGLSASVDGLPKPAEARVSDSAEPCGRHSGSVFG